MPFITPPVFPWLHGYAQHVQPLVYDESLSYEQQIASIAGRIATINNQSLNKSEFEEFYQWLCNSLEEVGEWMEQYAREIYKRLLAELVRDSQSNLVHNPVTGYISRDDIALRDIYNELAVYGISVDELSELEMTVDELSCSGLSVKGLAMYSTWLIPDHRPDCTCACANEGDEMPGKVTVGMLARGGILDEKIFVKDVEPLTVGALADSDVEADFFTEDKEGTNSNVSDVGTSIYDDDSFMKVSDNG